ncbi:Threonine/homoserine/homoserine lactone efflux protein [Quadrisphaera granulorum]|uniref:Threonine/homoserine/homoserine lactone efflux protein n=1 Tax=Quadrisphaera granulorum TaxID=317664 RepID=A0A316AAT2_9ACTN|nr:LysE family translocator [Quadrisphaera granulorum]PWJ54946.1 threonine/homoserine/homoserine lactone efflux protein [Quadrisphaera granulorum]SZE95892.1 Threonine/homoserine/homoserine lactone efflux protein [Quadrisphaera granulorum]
MALVALGVVLSPGPNMVFLLSRTLTQGRRAGMWGLLGVALGFAAYLVATVAGLAGLFRAVPLTFEVVKAAGAAYLGWLAYKALRSGGGLAALPQGTTIDQRRDSAVRLVTTGLVTNLLNPKIALMYAALLPQFVRADAGAASAQLLQLGAVQIAVALTVNGLIVVTAARVAVVLQRRPRLLLTQRLTAAGLLTFFAVKTLLTSAPRASA